MILHLPLGLSQAWNSRGRSAGTFKLRGLCEHISLRAAPAHSLDEPPRWSHHLATQACGVTCPLCLELMVVEVEELLIIPGAELGPIDLAYYLEGALKRHVQAILARGVSP